MLRGACCVLHLVRCMLRRCTSAGAKVVAAAALPDVDVVCVVAGIDVCMKCQQSLPKARCVMRRGHCNMERCRCNNLATLQSATLQHAACNRAAGSVQRGGCDRRPGGGLCHLLSAYYRLYHLMLQASFSVSQWKKKQVIDCQVTQTLMNAY
jgi:hypothetical protein